MNIKRTAISASVGAALGLGAMAMPTAASAVTLANGIYDMTITNTPFTGGSYQVGTDGAWNSSFTFGAVPTNGGSVGLYDDTVASPVLGRYQGNPNDGVHGTVSITVVNGVISSGDGTNEFDMLPGTAGGNFVEYGTVGWSGSIDAGGNISLTPTGMLGAVAAGLVDKAWNIDNFNGITGTNPNPPTTNTIYDTFSTTSATNATGTINGAVFDGTSAVLVKGGTVGSAWGSFFGAQYFEVWDVGFTRISDVPLHLPRYGCLVWPAGLGRCREAEEAADCLRTGMADYSALDGIG